MRRGNRPLEGGIDGDPRGGLDSQVASRNASARRRRAGTSRFPTAAHLVSWAKFCPQTHQSAGKTKRKGRGKGNPWLGGTLGRIVFGLSRTDTFLGTRYRRLAKRRGKQKAIVALGNSVLTVVYHLLADPKARFDDLGPGFYESRINTNRRARNLATQLQAITGQKIVIRDGKAVIAESAA